MELEALNHMQKGIFWLMSLCIENIDIPLIINITIKQNLII